MVVWGVRSRRWRWWSRLSITRVWRAVSDVQPRSSASARNVLMSSSCAVIAGMNSAVVVKFEQVSQMFA